MKVNNMSTANRLKDACTASTLTSLLDYLYGTLSPSNMRWVGEHLIEYSKAAIKREQSDACINSAELEQTRPKVKKEVSEQLRPYTMQEIDDMLDEAEAAFEAGDYLTNDEVFHHKEKVAV